MLEDRRLLRARERRLTLPAAVRRRPRFQPGLRRTLLLLLCIATSTGAIATEKTALTDCPREQNLPWKVRAERATPVENFVQGFEIDGAHWWMSNGGYGRSHVDILDPRGQPVRRQRLAPDLFAEGLTLRDDELWLLSWRAGQLLRLDRDTLQLRGRLAYSGEGWGLAWDAERQHFLMSDGSGTLSWREPERFAVTARLPVRRGLRRVSRLNELEIAGEHLYANVWMEDEILRIDRRNGCVTGHLDLKTLWPQRARPRSADVLNGIAHDPASDWLWVTGKFWGRAFALEIIDDSAAQTGSHKSDARRD